MGIVSNAADEEEKSSPFYAKNETICQSFDAFIDGLGGKTIGAYNAWSYNAKGKVQGRNLWIFQIKKSTYSSGNLLLSSAYQGIHLAEIWKCKDLVTELPDFEIRLKKRFDFIRLKSKNTRLLKGFKKYVIVSKGQNHPLASKITDLLLGLLRSKCVFNISYAKNELIIDLRTSKMYEDKIKQLIETSF